MRGGLEFASGNVIEKNAGGDVLQYRGGSLLGYID